MLQVPNLMFDITFFEPIDKSQKGMARQQSLL